MISASSLERIDHCAPSAVLTPRSNETGEQAVKGNVLHEFTRRVAKNPAARVAALECVEQLEWKKTAAHLDLATALDQLEVKITEPAYAVDAATGSITYLGENIARDYAGAMQRLYKRDLLPTEFCVSLDVEAMHTGGYPTAADWKSGVKRTACKDMWQVLLQCYVLGVKYDADQVEGRVLYIEADGNVIIDDHIFSRMELDGVPARLMSILKRVVAAQVEISAGKVPTVHAGDWCRYCEAMISCPAQTALVRVMLPELEAIEAGISGLTVAQLGTAWAKWKQISQLGEKLEKAMKLRLYAEGSAPADEGYEYRVEERAGKMSLNGDKVRGLLTILGATQEQIDSVVTKGAAYPVINRRKVIET